MFSADTTLHGFGGHSSRNPRRRNRSSGEDYTGSVAQAPKRRKRSSIAPNTFDPLSISKANGSAFKGNNEIVVKENGAREKTPEPEAVFEHHQNGNSEKTTSLVTRTRSGRSVRDRKPTRHDEGLLLAKNDRYLVSKETSLPDEVQDVIRAKEPWQATFNEELGCVVLLTHHKAVVWRYAQNTTTEARVSLIKFQNVTTKPKDPLPLGVLVHDLGVGELALLVIKAAGKVTYWKSVSSAANADVLRQKQNAIHGSVGGLLSGEQVVDIEEAEPGGFVLTTSAGRVLHLSVSGGESQNRGTIITDVLRSNPSASGGLFSGLKNVFSISGWQRDIASVKCTRSKTKGSRKCLIATKQGLFQVWHLERQTNNTTPELQLDLKSQILGAIKPVDGPLGDFQVIDFTLMVNKKKKDDFHHVLVLAGAKVGQVWSYALVEIALQTDGADVKAVYPLQFWSHPPEEAKSWLGARSHLFVPEPGHTAFVMFDGAVLVASLTRNRQGPDAQLMDELDPKADAFQDILYFAKDRDFHISGCAVEPSSQSGAASCLFFVNEFGLAHVTATKSDNNESADTRRTTQCKTKIEQVVFFGDIPNKLFDFQRAMDISDWSTEEVQTAALKVNASILSSSSAYVPVATPSMDHQLKDRSSNLKSLIKFISRWNINAETRWELLWSAEKMAAARAVWQTYATHLSKKEDQKIPFRGRNTVLLWEALDSINEIHKHEINPEKGENDIVRQFLTRDVHLLELLVAWSARAIEEMVKDDITNSVMQAWLISQASDVFRVAMDTAYKFRENNAALYGFAPELFEDGIYKGSYKALPEIWTSCAEVCVAASDLARDTQDIAMTLNNSEESDEEGPEIDQNDFIKLVEDSVSLARLYCQVFEERTLSQDNASEETKQKLEDSISEHRRELLVGLVELMVPDEGLRLAEKYRDLETLADIICRSMKIIADRLKTGIEEERETLEVKWNDYEQRVAKYFNDYGMSWAQAFYSEKMARETVSGVLKSGGPLLSEYLSKNPSLTKVKWIYDVGSGQAYKGAVHDLLKCNSDEPNMWNKKVQLSLAKLSLLAAQEKNQIDQELATAQMRHADRRLTTIQIQDQLYDYTRPQLQSALDQIAEVDLAMGTFGKKVKSTKIQAAMFRASIEKLVTRQWIGEENLIDALTLLYCPEDLLDDAAFASHRFFFALQTLRDSPTYEDSARTSITQKIIWRRCIIQDDWSSINMTDLKSDEEVAREAESTALFKTLLAGFHDGLLESDLPPPQNLESLLGAGTTPDELILIARWVQADEASLNAISADFAAEDKKLRKMLEKGRLDSWWQGLISAAKAELRSRLDGEGEANALEMQKTRDVERRLRKVDLDTNESGYINGVNGHGENQHADTRDQEGDVIMG